MEWRREDAFGYDEYVFYDSADKYLGSFIPKRNKINISRDLTKEELEFIYNVIKYR